MLFDNEQVTVAVHLEALEANLVASTAFRGEEAGASSTLDSNRCINIKCLTIVTYCIHSHSICYACGGTFCCGIMMQCLAEQCGHGCQHSTHRAAVAVAIVIVCMQLVAAVTRALSAGKCVQSCAALLLTIHAVHITVTQYLTVTFHVTACLFKKTHLCSCLHHVCAAIAAAAAVHQQGAGGTRFTFNGQDPNDIFRAFFGDQGGADLFGGAGQVTVALVTSCL
jgi:hypothetical protein